MSDFIEEMVKSLKMRDNPELIGYMIGDVVSDLPQIQIQLSDNILLKKDRLSICNRVIRYVDGEPKLVEGTTQVVLVPSSDFQSFAVVDKLVVV